MPLSSTLPVRSSSHSTGLQRLRWSAVRRPSADRSALPWRGTPRSPRRRPSRPSALRATAQPSCTEQSSANSSGCALCEEIWSRLCAMPTESHPFPTRDSRGSSRPPPSSTARASHCWEATSWTPPHGQNARSPLAPGTRSARHRAVCRVGRGRQRHARRPCAGEIAHRRGRTTLSAGRQSPVCRDHPACAPPGRAARGGTGAAVGRSAPRAQ